MSSPVIVNPAYVDGIASVLDSLAQNLNLGVDYLYRGDALGQKGVHTLVTDPAGQAAGSQTTATGVFSGNLDFQLLAAADALPRPSDIILLRAGYYKVAGDIGAKREKNKAVLVSVPLESCINPVITTCLGTYGPIYTATHASGGTSYTKTFAAANTRTGATLAWSIEPWTEEYPTAAVPSGMSINSGTGALTYTTPVAGTYYIKVKCKDTAAVSVPAQPDRTGVGFLILTIT